MSKEKVHFNQSSCSSYFSKKVTELRSNLCTLMEDAWQRTIFSQWPVQLC